jgi:hypothetical protein
MNPHVLCLKETFLEDLRKPINKISEVLQARIKGLTGV